MSDWLLLFFLTLIAGIAMPIGALFASIEHISRGWLERELRHTIISFGGGTLVAAIALVLVHEGMQNLSFLWAILCFALGGALFMALDILLNKMKDEAPQLIAMLLDFIPEVLALGALFLLQKQYAYLLAFLIFLQNLPEGFNAFLELKQIGKYKPSKIILLFAALSLLGPIAALSGYFFLTENPEIISGVMLFAAGGILYLIFQDIAPKAKLKRHWGPSLGAVMGFLLGMAGKMLIIRSVS